MDIQIINFGLSSRCRHVCGHYPIITNNMPIKIKTGHPSIAGFATGSLGIVLVVSQASDHAQLSVHRFGINIVLMLLPQISLVVLIIVAGLCLIGTVKFSILGLFVEFFLLDSIRFHMDRSKIACRMRIRAGSQDEDDFLKLVDVMEAAARPKAFYKIAYIEARSGDRITIDQVEFQSQVLCINLGEVHRVFAFVATCGEELAAIRGRDEDFLHQYWADGIMEEALHVAMEALYADLICRFGPGQTASMNPGSLDDWPISQQVPFFQLLGPEAKKTGVRLTESLLMVPSKSVSGFIFETESGFTSCRLCPRKVCPNRRAEYNPRLMEEKYRL